MLKNTLKSHGCSRTISVPPGPEQFVALRENNKNCRWKRPPRTAGAACRVTAFRWRWVGNTSRTKMEAYCRRARPARPRSGRAASRRRWATSPTRTANCTLPPASAWLAWLTPLCQDQSSTAQLDVVVRPENSETGKIAMIQRGDLYGVHKFPRWFICRISDAKAQNVSSEAKEKSKVAKR